MKLSPPKSIAAGAVSLPAVPLYLLLPLEVAVGYAVAVAVLALIAAVCIVLRSYIFPTVNDGYDVARNRRSYKERAATATPNEWAASFVLDKAGTWQAEWRTTPPGGVDVATFYVHPP